MTPLLEISILLIAIISILMFINDLKTKKAERNSHKEMLSHYIELKKHFLKSKFLYKASEIYNQLPKCDNCDENRRIKFKNPLGNEMSIPCSCAGLKKVWQINKVKVDDFDDKGLYISNNEIKLVRYNIMEGITFVNGIYTKAEYVNRYDSYAPLFTTKKEAIRYSKMFVA